MRRRLIDADALREVMYHEAFEKDTDMQRRKDGRIGNIGTFWERIGGILVV